MAVAGLEFEFVEAAVGGDVPVAGGGVKLAVDAVESFGAVAAVQVHITLEIGDFDLAVAGAKVDLSLARHLDEDVDCCSNPIEANAVVGITHVDLTSVAGLVFFDADAVFADLVAAG